MMSEPTFVASRDGLCGFVLVVEDGERLTLTPLPATCWAYSATASKQSRQWCKTQLYAARRPERAPPPVFGGIDCGDASSRLCSYPNKIGRLNTLPMFPQQAASKSSLRPFYGLLEPTFRQAQLA